MTDNSKSIHEFEQSKLSITYDQMIAYMNAKFPDTTCPHCSSDEGWYADTGNEEDHSDALETMTLYRNNYVNNKLFRVFVVMTCANCGTMRSIAAQRVREWVNENPELANG